MIVGCESMVGGDVLDARGEYMGRIEHIVIDASHGRIAYAILGRGGVFGIGETLFAVPWNALGFDAEHGALVLQAGHPRLDVGRAFDHERWPSMGDPEWARAVHDAYETVPYWEKEGR